MIICVDYFLIPFLFLFSNIDNVFNIDKNMFNFVVGTYTRLYISLINLNIVYYLFIL